jgi:hypothetical protein
MRAKSEGLTAMKPEYVGTVNHGQRRRFLYALISMA